MAGDQPALTVPAEVDLIVKHYLQLADRALPGTIAGLYLTGSLALGDYHPGHSDIDFIAVSPVPLSAEELDHVERIHQFMDAEHPNPWFSGIYVT